MSKFITAGLSAAIFLALAYSVGAQCRMSFSSTSNLTVNYSPDALASGD